MSITPHVLGAEQPPRFCTHCGTNLRQEALAVAHDPVTGKQLHHITRHCPNRDSSLDGQMHDHWTYDRMGRSWFDHIEYQQRYRSN